MGLHPPQSHLATLPVSAFTRRVPAFCANLDTDMTEKRSVRFIGRDEFVEGIKKQFSPEYAEFFLIHAGHSPKVCAPSVAMVLSRRFGSLSRTMQLTARCGRNGIFGATNVLRASAAL